MDWVGDRFDSSSEKIVQRVRLVQFRFIRLSCRHEARLHSGRAAGKYLDEMRALPELFARCCQHLSDAIIQQPTIFDAAWQSHGAPVSKPLLVDDISTLLANVDDDEQAALLLNSFKQHQLARIAFGDSLLVTIFRIVHAKLFAQS